MSEEIKDPKMIRKCPLCGREYLKPKDMCDKCNLVLVKLSQYEKLKLDPVRFKQAEMEREQANKPKCPTCGSTNVEKISTAKKAVGFAMVGVFSSNLGKTMHCKNCGYKW